MNSRLTPARPGTTVRTLVAAAVALLFALAMAALPGRSALAATGDPNDLHVDAYLVTAKYSGIAVDIKVLNGAVTDATSVRVTAHRAVGPDVVKVSSGSGVVTTLNAGSSVTAPIVIRPGTYDEAGSSSWTKPVGAVWTAETVPTSVTVEVLNASGVVLSKTVSAPSSGPTGATLADVMPPTPTLTARGATYASIAKYSGIIVEFATNGFTDAESVSVRVDRASGGPAVKLAKQSVLDGINNGGYKLTTAPIVIQRGTYDEAASSSWYVPSAVWTSETVPTSVTVTIERAYGPAIQVTMSVGGSAAGILPEASAPVEVTVPADQPGGGSFDVVIPEGQTGGELNLGAAAAGSVTVPVEVNVVSPLGVTVTLPKDVTVTATGPDAAAWDGVLELPTVVEDVEIPATGGTTPTVGLAIEVGSPGMRLTFDAPVKLVLTGQAGMKAGFVQGGVFTAIDTECSANPPVGLTDGECWIVDGDDLVIWTTHFTTFVAYSTTAALPATGAEVPPLLLGAVGVLGLAGVGLVLLGRTRRAAA